VPLGEFDLQTEIVSDAPRGRRIGRSASRPGAGIMLVAVPP
jgi:hypothetical protein